MSSSKSLPLSGGVAVNDRFMPFSDLEANARRVADGLLKLGVGSGDSVALLLRNDIPFLEVSYGAMMIGAYVVPINWHFKADEVLYVILDCGAKVVIGHGDLLSALDEDFPAGVTVIEIVTPSDIVARGASRASRRARDSSILEYYAWIEGQELYAGPTNPPPQSMIYTSGTTGRPKGVRREMPTQEQLDVVAQMRTDVYGLLPGVRSVLAGPLYHAAPNSFGTRSGQIADLFVLMPYFDPINFMQIVDEQKIDTTFMVPTMFIRLLRVPEEVRARYDLSSLKFVVHAGSPCPAEIKKAMIDWLGPVVYEYYGSTESGAVTFINSADALQKPGSVGRAYRNSIVKILDGDGNDLPVGEIGQIYVRLPNYPDFEYHGAPEKRKEVACGELITCGDMGYLDKDGYLFICDRKSDMVISGGVNIYPAEIEAVLIQLPGIKDCAVFGIPDPEFGETLIAFVELLEEGAMDINTLRSDLAKRLADYKIPKQFEIRKNLPREDSGKIFKKRLREPYWIDAGRRI